MLIAATFEWSQVSAIAACIGVAIALFFHIKNLANTRLSNSAKMVLDLVASFDSPDMRRRRRRFAKMLLEDRTQVDPCSNTPVLEFFEEVAYMTRRGVLDRGMVWNSFFWFIEHYYTAISTPLDLIEKARRDSHSFTLYRELVWLHNELCIICAREEGSTKYMPPNVDDIRGFLQDEAELHESEET